MDIYRDQSPRAYPECSNRCVPGNCCHFRKIASGPFRWECAPSRAHPVPGYPVGFIKIGKKILWVRPTRCMPPAFYLLARWSASIIDSIWRILNSSPLTWACHRFHMFSAVPWWGLWPLRKTRRLGRSTNSIAPPDQTSGRGPFEIWPMRYWEWWWNSRRRTISRMQLFCAYVVRWQCAAFSSTINWPTAPGWWTRHPSWETRHVRPHRMSIDARNLVRSVYSEWNDWSVSWLDVVHHRQWWRFIQKRE